MKKNISKFVVLTSMGGTLFVSTAFLGLLTPFYEFKYLELIFNISLFCPFILFFSLVTYFAPERVFQSWWKFARIAIPLIFIPVLLINLEVHHSKNGQWQDIFDLQILILLYSIFTIGSIWAIWKRWRSK
jgi:hypothetical protein